jgi:Bacterial membrane protein YfhO
MSNFFKNNWIHFAAFAIGLIVCLVKFSPQLDGNAIKQDDIEQHKGMSQEVSSYYKNGRVIGWTNSMFGGMPATQISMRYEGNIISTLNTAYLTTFGNPIGIVLMYFIGFYILMCCLKINSWIGIVMSLCFAFVSYDIIIIQAGHNSKALAVAWMAPVVGAFFVTYQRSILWGALLSALFMAFEMVQNHLQVTYYLGILLICLGAAAFANALITKELGRFFKASGALVLAYGLALLINVGNILGTSNYGSESIRGGNDVKIDAAGDSNESNETSGLDRDYVVNWSNGIGESLSLMSPYVKGSHSGALGNSQFADKIASMDITSDEMNGANNSSAYWGEQPGVSGPAYVGAITVFLAILGLVFLKGTWKWGVFVATMLTIMLSWGKNYMGLTNFFLDNVPGYNKFRAVTILVVIAELTLPLLAALLLNEFYKNRDLFVAKKKLLLITCSAVLAFVLVVKFVGVGGYVTSQEKEQLSGIEKNFRDQIGQIPADELQNKFNVNASNPAEVEAFLKSQVAGATEKQEQQFSAVKKVRASIFQSSLNSTFFLILVAAALLLLSVYTKSLPVIYAVVAIAVINFGDLLLVSSNYLNADEEGNGYKYWTSRVETIYPIAGSGADQQILDFELKENPSLRKFIDAGKKQGEELAAADEATGEAEANRIKAYVFSALGSHTNYRVWEPETNFGRANVSMYHKSLGGYHAVKLRNIQNLFDFHLSKGNNAVLNMMNVKYIIVSNGGQKMARQNPDNCGSTWLVKNVNTFSTADEEIRALGSMFEIKNVGSGTFVVNGVAKQSAMVTGSEKLQYVADKDSLNVPLSNGVKEGEKIFYVSDTAGKADLVPEITVLNDKLNSFNEMVQITVTSAFDPKNEAVMLSSVASKLSAKTFSGLGSIRMKMYDPEHLVYQFSAPEKQLAVFSEIYYTKGWTAHIDGKEVPILKTNYLLRGLEIPKGEHKIEFKFVTPKLAAFNILSTITCLLLFALIGVVGYLSTKKKAKELVEK